jgi:hypothetical protein
MHINTQQGSRSIGYDNLRVADSERVTSTQIACGRQRPTIEPNGLSGGLDDPDPLTPFYGECGSGFGTRDDDVRVRTANGYRFAENPLTQRFANANLRISGGSHRGGVTHG